MGDPVTTGMMIGAAGGALTSDNPLKGAMIGGSLGAAGGYAGSSMMGAGTGGGFTGGGFGSIGTAGQTASGAGGLFGGAGNIFGQGGTASQIGQGLGLYNQFNQAFNQPQQRMQPMGVNIRPGGQVAPVDYMSLLNPQQQTVIRPATPSLI